MGIGCNYLHSTRGVSSLCANISLDATAAGKHAGPLSRHVLGYSVFAPVSALRNAAMRFYTVTAGWQFAGVKGKDITGTIYLTVKTLDTADSMLCRLTDGRYIKPLPLTLVDTETWMGAFGYFSLGSFVWLQMFISALLPRKNRQR